MLGSLAPRRRRILDIYMTITYIALSYLRRWLRSTSHLNMICDAVHTHITLQYGCGWADKFDHNLWKVEIAVRYLSCITGKRRQSNTL